MSAIVEHKIPFNPVRCNYCIHFLGGVKCEAFDEIPDEILNDLNTHKKPLLGQNNTMVFDPEKTERYNDVKNLLEEQHKLAVERANI